MAAHPLQGSAALRAEWAIPPYLTTSETPTDTASAPDAASSAQRASVYNASALLRTDTVQFYIGPTGSGTQPHWHTASWNGLLRGRKRWLLWPPERASYAHRHVTRSAGAAVEAAGTPLICEQHAGDVLLVPPLWGHATFNMQPVLGFATELAAAERAGGHELIVEEVLRAIGQTDSRHAH